MSIAVQLENLATNKAAIKSAIQAKSPSVAPTDALSQWPTAIASISGGGGGASLDGIIAAVEAMDGLDHTGATSAQLETAIAQVVRKADRRASVDSEPTYTPDAGKTAFVVRVYNDGERGLQFTVGGWARKSGSSSVTVWWGDGTSDTSTDTGAVRLTHTYAAAGDYMVQISDDVTRWYPHFADPTTTSNFTNAYASPNGNWSLVVSDGRTDGYWSVLNVMKVHRMLQWGSSVTSAAYTFVGCVGLVGPAPSWGPAISNASATYAYCYCLSGPIPEWGAAVTKADSTYAYCYGLSGQLPEWGANMVNTYGAYYDCIGITGRIPEWNSKVTDVRATYRNCPGLTGRVPAWGSTILYVNETYYGCVGLTGPIPSTWPSGVTQANSTFYNCPGLTGAPPAWGDSMTQAVNTFAYCCGLTGPIPAWKSAMQNANSTYCYCRGLTGSIPAWGANITNARQTYHECRALSGSVPDWNSKITTAENTYYDCVGLTGSVPAWGSAITSASGTYYSCTGLSGAIPEWGGAITNASSTYRYCKGLNAVWSGATDATLMPSKITSKSSCVSDTSNELRAYFLTAWGGSRAS